MPDAPGGWIGQMGVWQIGRAVNPSMPNRRTFLIMKQDRFNTVRRFWPTLWSYLTKVTILFVQFSPKAKAVEVVLFTVTNRQTRLDPVSSVFSLYGVGMMLGLPPGHFQFFFFL